MNTPETIKITDKNVVLLLLVAEIPLVDFKKDENNKTGFYFDKEKASPYIYNYPNQSRESYGFDKFIRALGTFNSIIHSR